MATTTYDCIVVGAGIEGSATAYELAKRSKNVLLLEQYTLGHNRGSSHGPSRITRRVYSDDEYTKMMLEAYPRWATLERECQQQLFVKTGTLILGPREDAQNQTSVFPEDLERFRKALSKNNLPSEVLTSGQQLNKRFPGLRYPDNYVGVFDPDGGILKADRCLRAFHEQFKKLGGTLKDGETVVETKQRGDEITVVTSKATYRSRDLVLCLGPWIVDFLKRHFGVSLPLETQTVKVCYWRDKSETQIYSDRKFPCVLYEEGNTHFYSLPSSEYPGMFKFCYHAGPPASPEARDSVDASYIVEKCSKYIAQHLPMIDGGTPTIVDTCMYTVTPDEDFILDRLPGYPHIVVGTGFSGHGFKLSPVVGRVLADFVCKQDAQSPYNLKMFSAKRFAGISKSNL